MPLTFSTVSIYKGLHSFHITKKREFTGSRYKKKLVQPNDTVQACCVRVKQDDKPMGGGQCKWIATIMCLFRDCRYNYVKLS